MSIRFKSLPVKQPPKVAPTIKEVGDEESIRFKAFEGILSTETGVIGKNIYCPKLSETDDGEIIYHPLHEITTRIVEEYPHIEGLEDKIAYKPSFGFRNI